MNSAGLLFRGLFDILNASLLNLSGTYTISTSTLKQTARYGRLCTVMYIIGLHREYIDQVLGDKTNACTTFSQTQERNYASGTTILCQSMYLILYKTGTRYHLTVERRHASHSMNCCQQKIRWSHLLLIDAVLSPNNFHCCTTNQATLSRYVIQTTLYNILGGTIFWNTYQEADAYIGYIHKKIFQ